MNYSDTTNNQKAHISFIDIFATSINMFGCVTLIIKKIMEHLEMAFQKQIMMVKSAVLNWQICSIVGIIGHLCVTCSRPIYMKNALTTRAWPHQKMPYAFLQKGT